MLGKNSCIYPGLETFLRSLAGSATRWGIVTNKPVQFAEPLVKQLNMLDLCATLICPDHVTHKKPHPEPLLLAAHQLSLDSEEIVYVGDHRRDIEAGEAASMRTVAVSYGYLADGDDAASWQADHLVHQSNELVELLGSLINKTG